jgi:hypothetical protein
VSGLAALNVASAGESHYRSAKDGVEITYDDAQWAASELIYPYFTCIAPDCGSASCLVIPSLDPDFAKWPETIDKASLDALDDIFLEYEQSGGRDDAEIVQPVSAVTIGGRETLVSVIRSKSAGGGSLSSKYMFRDAGDTRIVTCEGDEESITALKGRIEALISAIKFTAQ